MFSMFKNKESLFWDWFIENEEIIFNFETNRDQIFKRISNELTQINKDLTFEISSILEDGKREFIISASGIKSAFPFVESLYAKTPNLDRWTFIKYRPRREPINDIMFLDKTIKSDDVYYALFTDNSEIGIMLFFNSYKEKEKKMWAQVGYLMLDEALGEYDVETKVGSIEFKSTHSEYFKYAKPLKELAKDFDQIISQ